MDAVGRDRLAADSRDEARQMVLCGWMWMIRQIGLVAILVVGITDDGFGRSDLLVLIATVISAAIYLASRFAPRVVGVATILDAFVLAGLTLAGLRPVAVLLIGVIILAWAAAFRPLYAAGAYVGVATAIILLYATGERPHPWLAAIAFCVLGAILVVRAVRLNMTARRGDERGRLVAEAVDAMIWELQPDGGYRITDNSARILGYPAELDGPGVLVDDHAPR